MNLQSKNRQLDLFEGKLFEPPKSSSPNFVLKKSSDSPVVFIICAYNEGEHIGRTLRLLHQTGIQGRVIVVDDGSELRNTSMAAMNVGVRLFGKNFELVRLNQNVGKAAAFFKGLKVALDGHSPKAIVSLDADMLKVPRLWLGLLIGPSIFASYQKKPCMMVAQTREGRDIGELGTINLSGIRSFSYSTALSIHRNRFKKEATGYGLEVWLNEHYYRVRKDIPWVSNSKDHFVQRESYAGGRDRFIQQETDIAKTLKRLSRHRRP